MILSGRPQRVVTAAGAVAIRNPSLDCFFALLSGLDSDLDIALLAGVATSPELASPALFVAAQWQPHRGNKPEGEGWVSRQKRRQHQRKEPNRNTPQGRSVGKIVKVALATILIITASFGVFAFIKHNRPTSPETLNAVIADQLILTYPDPGFVAEATKILEQAGYEVDYIPGEKVTVDFFRSLPTKHYDMVVLRAHSGLYELADGTLTDDVDIFTGEAYDRAKYPEEQRAGFLNKADYLEVNPPLYGFTITASFIRQKLEGRFKDAKVILMGCDGLRSTKMADAFLEKGAKAFISWDSGVSTGQTDKATTILLKYLLVDKLPVESAVSQTAKEVGPDPQGGGKLVFRSSQG